MHIFGRFTTFATNFAAGYGCKLDPIQHYGPNECYRDPVKLYDRWSQYKRVNAFGAPPEIGR